VYVFSCCLHRVKAQVANRFHNIILVSTDVPGDIQLLPYRVKAQVVNWFHNIVLVSTDVPGDIQLLP
jgi:hypothetical protein